MDIGAPELLIILVVALLIFGPGRIASLGKEIGEGISKFRQGLGSPNESSTEEDQTKP